MPRNPARLAQEWIEAWNSHDLERILSHYEDGFVMRSQFIRLIAGENSGVLQGKSEVAAYWSEALLRTPDLRFELISFAVGIDSVAIQYKNQKGANCIEVLEFGESGRVHSARAHYGVFEAASERSAIRPREAAPG